MKRRHLIPALAAVPAAAQTSAAGGWSNPFVKTLRDSFREHWLDTREYTLAMIDAMPADGFDFKAHPSQRSFGEQVQHLAWANLLYFRGFGIASVEDPFPKTYAEVRKQSPPSDKAATVKFVAATFDFTLALLDRMTERDLLRTDLQPVPKAPPHSTIDVFLRAYMHTAHHRGQVVTYLRVRGLVPPAWKFEPSV